MNKTFAGSRAVRKPVVLLVDDDPEIHRLLDVKLCREDFALVHALDADRAAEAMAASPALVLLDIRMPADREGIEILRSIKKVRPELPVIMLSSRGEVETVVESLRCGAEDFFHKPDLASSKKFAQLIERIRELAGRNERGGSRPEAMHPYPGFEDIIGKDEPVRNMINLARLAAPEDVNVLLQGETGTGKEILAKAIHRCSPRSAGPFIAVNCSAIPENLAESEFFGHVKGAFSGASAAREGKFGEADGGTLFLDEIGEMPLSLQAKILRAIEDKRVIPVGGNTGRKADCRIVAATNRDLNAEIGKNTFREDLYYRLCTFPISLPALRERKKDIPLLLEHFIHKHGKSAPVRISPVLLEKLAAFDFPGNIRQLENMVRYALIVAGGGELTLSHFPMLNGKASERENYSLAENEKMAILAALNSTGHNRSQTARILGVSRPTLLKKIREYSLEDKE